MKFGILLFLLASGSVFALPEIQIKTFYAEKDGIIQPGEKPEFVLEAENPGKEPLRAEIHTSIKRFGEENESPFHSFKLELPPGKSSVYRWNCEHPPEKNGYYRVKAFSASGGDKSLAECGFAIVPGVPKRDPFFGFNNNTFSFRQFEAYRKIGVGSLEVGYPAYFFSYPENCTFAEYKKILSGTFMIKALMEEAEKGNFHFVAKLSPEFLRKNSSPTGQGEKYRKAIAERGGAKALYPFPDSAYQHMRDHASALYELFGGKIKIWMIQAEIDGIMTERQNTASGFNVLELANFVIASRNYYESVKAKDPNATVATLGIYGGDFFHSNPPFKISRLLLEDLSNYHDAMCIDAYSGNWSTNAPPTPPEQGGLADYLRASVTLQKEFGKQGIVYNAERGYHQKHSDPLDSPNSKLFADLSARSLIIAKGIRGVEYYSFYYGALEPWPKFLESLKNKKEFDDGTLWIIAPSVGSDYRYSPPGTKASFVHVPRPAVAAFATVARVLAFAEPVRGGMPKISEDMHVCIFKKDDEHLAAVWSSGEPCKLTFDSPCELLHVDLTGVESPLKAGKNTLDVTSSPFFVIGKLSSVQIKKIFSEAVVSGNRELNLKLARSGNGSLLLKASNLTDKKLSVAAAAQEIVLKPYETREVALPETEKESLKVSAAGKTYELAVPPLPLKIARCKEVQVDGNPEKYGVSLVKLTAPENVFPQKTIAPEYGFFKHDGKDIEAEMFSAWDSRNLYLAFRVRDRRHIQRHSNSNMWMDDSVQFALIPNPGAENVSYKDGFGPGVYNFVMGLAANGPSLYRFGAKDRPGTACDYPCVISRNGNFTTYETAIPWESLGMKNVEAGTALGFNFVVFDNNDPANASAKYWLAFAEGLANGQNPDAFPLLCLTEK